MEKMWYPIPISEVVPIEETGYWLQQENAHKLIEGKVVERLVIFSVGPIGGGGLAKLSAVAVEGKVRFSEQRVEEGNPYDSGAMENPTWLDVAVAANCMIHITGDKHHVFLEGIGVIGEDDGVKIVAFAMGS